jgi:hypothetical protein
MVLMLKGRYLPPGLVLSQQLPTGLLRLQQGALEQIGDPHLAA